MEKVYSLLFITQELGSIEKNDYESDEKTRERKYFIIHARINAIPYL